MSVVRFSRAEFEDVLPRHKDTGEALWQPLGLVQGEYQYVVLVSGTNKRIVIRSSVDASGYAAETGADSIRLWVEYFYSKSGKWHPLGKVDAWTTRVPGWERRVDEKLRKLYRLALRDSRKGGSHGTVGNAQVRNPEHEGGGDGQVASGETGGDGPEQVGDVGSDGVREPGDDQDGDPAKTDSGTGDVGGVPEMSGRDEVVGERSALDFLGEESRPAVDLEDELASEKVVRKAKVEGAKMPNKEQLAAIMADLDKPVVVLAGPGTGKTFVIERRYGQYLKMFTPEDILCVTFGKDASGDMKGRIMGLLPELAGTAAEDQICTIHAACYRMLKADGDRRSVVKHWVLKKNVQELAEKMWPYSDERPGWEEIMGFVNTAKFHGLTTTDDFDWFVQMTGHYHGSRLHDLRRQLDVALDKERALTFADMLFDVEQKLLKDNNFREYWQGKYKVVMVDEGQDTSGQAMRILTMLAAPQDRFFIVGDTDQLLYRFAGATPEANLFDGFESRFPGGLLFKLTKNYRSTKAIVRAYNELIRNNYSVGGGVYEDKYLKVVEAVKEEEGQPVTWGIFDTPDDEAMMLAESIKYDLDGAWKPGDIFIGARTRAQLGYLEGPLMRAKIPFVNITGGSFWTSKHVADVVAYVRLAMDDADTEAFQRVYNVGSKWCVYPWGAKQGEYCTHRYLGRAFLQACTDYKHREPTYELVDKAWKERSSYRPGIEDLEILLNEIRQAESVAGNPGDVVGAVLDNCYVKWLKYEEGIVVGDEAENGKLEDLYTVVHIASTFASVELFLEYVADCVKAARAVKDKDWDEYVVLSTVHRLKGLEREVVYGVGICENGQQGLLPHTFSMTPPPNLGVLPGGGMSRMEDERCVMYVLVSRAKSEVHLSGVREYRQMGMRPSRFLQEMGLVGVLESE